MNKEFTSGQKEIIARKLGYEGPMQGFESFLASSPALSAKYNMVTSKYVQRMAKGGLTSQRKVRKFATGGNVAEQLTATSTPAEIAAAYKAYTDTAGGDTQANREAAAKFLQDKGISDTNIQAGYTTYITPTGTTAGCSFS